MFSTKTLIEETVLTSPAGNRTAILCGQLSPPHRLPLGILIKIAIIENSKSSLFLSPRPPHNTKRPLRRREHAHPWKPCRVVAVYMATSR